MTLNIALLLPLSMLIALGVDRLFGEPPARLHPVVGMGRFLSAFETRLTALPSGPAFMGGALVWLLGALLSAALALALELWVMQLLVPWQSLPGLLTSALLLGLLLKPLLAWRMLADEVQAVEAALQRSLDEGRSQLARLVSRDTRQLSASEVREAALETLAENLNDSVVAPLFWFVIAGLPGAAVYRFANTADAMWGYRDHREFYGKFAAKADDALSWLPARLTGLCLMGMRVSLSALRREAARPPSPNGGWPMGALALRMNRCLSKPRVYTLNDAGTAPQAGDIPIAIRHCTQALSAVLPLLMGLALLLRMPT